MSDHRTPGKRGRLPALAPADRFPLKYLHEYTRSGRPLPAPRYPVDVSQGITDWGMLGNGPDPTCSSHPNGVGDCTFAGRQHYRMAKAARGQETESWVTWGAQQQSTTAWTVACLDEAWVVITQEDTNTDLIDIAALRADINALDGTGG